MQTTTLESELKRAKHFRKGQLDRRNGLPCMSANGSYLDGWYAPEKRVPPSLTEAQMIEHNI